jgi:CBS domain containing-hemolysin-like protein
MSILLLFFALALSISFLCSLWESVLLSITPSYVTRLRSDGGQIGATLEEFKADIDRPLAAILTLNTIAHTVGAIGVGAQASKLYASLTWSVVGIDISFEAVVAAVTTLAILIVSEIIPKTIGANSWERLVPFTVRSLRLLVLVLWPLVWMSQAITRTLKTDKNAPVFSRAEFLAMSEMGHAEGVLDDSEAKVIRNLMAFRERRVSDVMTPRTVLVTGNRAHTVQEFLDRHPDLGPSRIPTWDGGIDKVTGVILKDHVLAAAAAGRTSQLLGELETPAVFVHETLPLPALLKRLFSVPQQMAVVVDEFGVTVGVVTVEDALETLLGVEIIDEQDEVADLRRLAQERWHARRDGLDIG